MTRWPSRAVGASARLTFHDVSTNIVVTLNIALTESPGWAQSQTEHNKAPVRKVLREPPPVPELRVVWRADSDHDLAHRPRFGL